jgi:opacity protein-like surface antigen
MRKQLSTMAIVTTIFGSSFAFANGFDAVFSVGSAWTHFTSGNQLVNVYDGIVNQYTLSSSKTSPTFTLGLGYEWNQNPNIAVNLGLDAHYIKTDLHGINAPDVNGGSFDTLNYSANVQSLAFLLTPKVIYTAFSWQPYVEAGIGLSINQASDYAETPTDPDSGAQPTQTPFGDQKTDAFSYLFGVGIQHALWQGAHAPVLGISYEWMDWGKTDLGKSSGQTTQDQLSFGHLHTSSVNLNVTWPF